MCPFCIATAAAVAASATGTGGIAALVAGKLKKRTVSERLSEIADPKEVEHVHDDSARKDF